MRRGLVIGMANAGKTLFCTRFAEFLGVRDLQWLVERTDGRTESRRVLMVRNGDPSFGGSGPTRFLQSMCLQVSRHGRSKRLLLTDSAGLAERLEESGTDRASIAQTLSMLLDADLVLHVIDAHQIGCRAGEGSRAVGTNWLAGVDSLIAKFAEQKEGYLVLANKMDLPGGRAGYRYLCKRFSKQRVLPVSALYGMGFREVRQHVWRMA